MSTPNARVWTQEQDRLILDLYGTLGAEGVAVKLKLPAQAVRRRAKTLRSKVESGELDVPLDSLYSPEGNMKKSTQINRGIPRGHS